MAHVEARRETVRVSKAKAPKAAPLSQAAALAVLVDEIEVGGGEVVTAVSRLATRFGRAPQTVSDWLKAWSEEGKIVQELLGNRGRRITLATAARLEVPEAAKSEAVSEAPDNLAPEAPKDAPGAAASEGKSEAISEAPADPLVEASVDALSVARDPEGDVIAGPWKRRVKRRRPDPSASIALAPPGGAPAASITAAAPPPAASAPVIEILPPDRAGAVGSDDRITVNGKVANLVVNGLGIAAGVFFAWKGYQALDVSIHINTSYAESLAASESAKGLMKNAFAVVGYLAAFGAPAVETMLSLGQRRAAIGAALVTFCAFAFGLHAAMGFVATHTDATTKERAVFLARLAAADADAKRAQDALDRIGVAAWSQADQDELVAKVKSLPGGERACTAAKPSPAVVEACRRIADLREARSAVPKAEAARTQLTDAEARRKAVETEAKSAGVTLGSDANPVSLKISEHVQAASGMLIPLTPKGVDVAGFFFEALAPELAVLACFWLSGVLLTGSCAALFRRKSREG